MKYQFFPDISVEYSRISTGKNLSTKLDFDLILMADKP